jgi:O-methyltransferase/methyltransferase family protein
MTEAQPQAVLWGLVKGAMATQALHVACRFGVAERLAHGPRPVIEIAAEAGADADALYRFLRALATEGVFAEEEQGVFRNTAASELLRTGTEERWHEFALQFGDDWYRAFADAPHAAKTGDPTFPSVFGVRFEERLQADPERLATFNRSMEGGAAERAARIAELPWNAELVVDVGGGTGTMLVELLRRQPRLRGVLFDLPEVAAEAEQRIAASGLSSRCDIVGSFTDGVPQGDAYVLSRILHGCADETATAVLGNIRGAARPGARVVILDAVLPEGNEQHGGKWLDLLMLVLSGGRERTAAEWRALLEGAGLRVESIDDGLVQASCP